MISGAGIESGIPASREKIGLSYANPRAERTPMLKTLSVSAALVLTAMATAGAAPKATDRVKVHYHGTLTDGTVFDSSVQRGEPITLPLNGVIKCWTEGVSMMKVGGKSRLVCPSDIAYGDQGRPPVIKPGATLVFEVELLEIAKERRSHRDVRPARCRLGAPRGQGLCCPASWCRSRAVAVITAAA